MCASESASAVTSKIGEERLMPIPERRVWMEHEYSIQHPGDSLRRWGYIHLRLPMRSCSTARARFSIDSARAKMDDRHTIPRLVTIVIQRFAWMHDSYPHPQFARPAAVIVFRCVRYAVNIRSENVNFGFLFATLK